MKYSIKSARYNNFKDCADVCYMEGSFVIIVVLYPFQLHDPSWAERPAPSAYLRPPAFISDNNLEHTHPLQFSPHLISHSKAHLFVNKR